MASSSSDAPECSSSRSRTEPVEAVPRRLPWVALASFPDALADGDYLPRRSRIVTDDIILALHTPPRLSSLVVLPRLAALNHRDPTLRATAGAGFPYPYVHAAEGSLLLFEDLLVQEGSSSGASSTGLFLYDSSASGTQPRLLADIPADWRRGGLAGFRHGRSISLLADPTAGHHVVAILYPTTSDLDDLHILLTCSTAVRAKWVRTTVAAASPRRRHFPLGDHGVITHRSRLWWVCLAHGLFVCDPFAHDPEMVFVPLPPLPPGETQNRIGQRRCVKVSQDSLCFVQISTSGGSTYSSVRVTLSTLHDDDADRLNLNPWVLAYDATIDFAATEPPFRVTLIDPDDCYIC